MCVYEEEKTAESEFVLAKAKERKKKKGCDDYKKDRERNRLGGTDGRKEQTIAKPVKRSALLWINMNSSAHADLSSLPLLNTYQHISA